MNSWYYILYACSFLIFYAQPIIAAPTAKAAGVLPYATHDGQVYVLLGLEDRFWDTSKWTTSAVSKWVWGDFGGSCDNTDYDDLHCAVRECAEETGFVFGNTPPIPKPINRELQDQSISYLKSKKIKGVHGAGHYVQYFIEVNYIDEKTLYTEALKNAHEKVNFKWMKLVDLLTIVKNSPDVKGFFRVPLSAGKLDDNKLFPWFVQSLQKKDAQNFLNALKTRSVGLELLLNSKDVYMTSDPLVKGKSPFPVPSFVPGHRSKPDDKAIAQDYMNLVKTLNQMVQAL